MLSHDVHNASVPFLAALSMATCRTTYHGHREGWGPVSTLRVFDLTPCFEEGIILSTLLVILLVVSLSRLCETKSVTVSRALTSRSASVLKAKLVCFCVVLPVPTGNIFSQLPTFPFVNPSRHLIPTDLARSRFFH